MCLKISADAEITNTVTKNVILNVTYKHCAYFLKSEFYHENPSTFYIL